MTVAAVIVVVDAGAAVADADGVPGVRRIVDAAWSGGAVPIVLVGSDAGGIVAAALAGAPVTLADAAASAAAGRSSAVLRGIETARDLVADTDGWLIWPADMVWVGPETVTSLIETHGTTPAAVLRPTFEGVAGWPLLLPAAALESLRVLGRDARGPGGDAGLDDLTAGRLFGDAGPRELDLGDPGATHDRRTPHASLPPYLGPPEPTAGHVHEWGAAVADADDDEPVGGPARAR